jgi:hypothetical protein
MKRLRWRGWRLRILRRTTVSMMRPIRMGVMRRKR